MGVSIRDFWNMSIWEFYACVDGFNKANGDDQPPPISAERQLEIQRKFG